MRILLANSVAAVLVCTGVTLLCFFAGLLAHGQDRTKRALITSDEPPSKTFRTLLAVPAALRLHSSNRSGAGRSRQDGALTRSPDLVVEDGVFWSDRLESQLPGGFTDAHARVWRNKARSSRIISLEEGCGRATNRLATFSDNSKACVRYGINADQVQGEALSYYLASLLEIPNLPPLVLSQVSFSNEQWSEVQAQVRDSQWTENAVVSLTEFVSNLSGVVTPVPLRHEGRRLHPLSEDLRNRSRSELLEIVQWTDLILYDYLTANFDRLVSNLFSLQWDPRVMERDTRNLHRSADGGLVFIDNEAGLVHGYRVLGMWERYHDALLRSVCLFRRRTARRIWEMHRRQDAAERLLERYVDNEPLAARLGFLSEEQALVLQARVDHLYKHIAGCRKKYSRL
ncbi:four-jointed box protein 1 [Polypterus senegalus]